MPQFCLRVTPNDLILLGFLQEQLMLLRCTLITQGNLRQTISHAINVRKTYVLPRTCWHVDHKAQAR